MVVGLWEVHDDHVLWWLNDMVSIGEWCGLSLWSETGGLMSTDVGLGCVGNAPCV